MRSHCVIECPNCVVEKIHLFFLAGETESVFEITNWSTRNVIHHGFGDASLMLELLQLRDTEIKMYREVY